MNILEKPTSRRRFLAGAGTAAATTVVLNTATTRMAFATPQDPSRGDALVVVYLRFGADGLSHTPPIGAAFDSYRALRPTIHITPDQALPLDDSNRNARFPQGMSGVLGLHPSLRGLYDTVWASGNMAVLPATGMPDSESRTRSHFTAQYNMEIGTASADVRTGWLTRITNGQPASGVVPGVAAMSGRPTLYRGSLSAVSVPNLSNFGVDGFPNRGDALEALTLMHQGSGQINQVGRTTLAAASALATADSDGGSGYPDTGFGNDLRDVDNVLRSNVGLTTATVSIGGWDNHSNQGTIGGQFDEQTIELNDGLTAFVNDLGPALNETTIMVISEFGRTIGENSSAGTDHGRGGTAFIIGGGIQGGVYGYDYPDVIEDSSANRRALPVLTDYRKAFDEVAQARIGVTGSFPTLGNDLPDLGLVR